MSNIVETEIAAPPASYEAYQYQYTNLDNDMIYLGIHKGSVDDGYNHSSSNDEFNSCWVGSTKFRYEVSIYGDYCEMQNVEHKLLTKADARNNPKYYNKTNGYPSYKDPDLKKCKSLFQQIIDGIYDVGKEPLDVHVDMNYIQSRYEHNAETQRVVKEKINDAKGNTDGCSSVVVYEQRGKNGEDIRGDGNHTVFGASQSKHARDIPVARIPYKIHKDYTDEELKGIGNLLNKKPKKIKKPVDLKDGTKHILDNYENGVPYNSNNNVEWLQAYGFTGSLSTGQVSRIIKNAKNIIDTKELEMNNLLFINYKAKPHSTVLSDVVDLFGQNLDMCSIYMSSGKFSSDRILEKLYAAKELKKKIIMVVIHHPSLEQEKLWKKQIQPAWLNKFEYLFRDELEVRFHEMPTTMLDGSQV